MKEINSEKQSYFSPGLIGATQLHGEESARSIIWSRQDFMARSKGKERDEQEQTFPQQQKPLRWAQIPYGIALETSRESNSYY